MGLLSKILELEERRPLLKAQAELAAAQAAQTKAEAQFMEKFLGGLDGVVKNDPNVDVNSLSELSRAIQSQGGQAAQSVPSGVLDKLLSAQGGGSPSPQMSNGFNVSDPTTAMLLDKAGGFDFMGALKTNQTAERNNVLKRQGDTRNMLGALSFNLRDAQHKFNKRKVTWQPQFIDGVEFNIPYLPDGTIAEIEPIRVRGKKAMTGETAGKFNMLQISKDALVDVRSALVKPDGTIDRMLLANMTFATPGTRGRTLAQAMLDALEGKIRIESGAAVPPEEIKRLAKRAKPSLLDSDEGVVAKLDRLEAFVNGTIEVLDPNKIYGQDVETFVAEDGKQYVIIPGTTEADLGSVDYIYKDGKLVKP